MHDDGITRVRVCRQVRNLTGEDVEGVSDKYIVIRDTDTCVDGGKLDSLEDVWELGGIIPAERRHQEFIKGYIFEVEGDCRERQQ